MRTFLLLATALAAAPSASAQGINIDIHDVWGTPSSALGAAGAQPGVWNAVPATPATTPLVDLAGAATAASISVTGLAVGFDTDNAGTSGDDQALMDDLSDPSPSGATWTISGLTAGNYILITYAWAPDNPAFRSVVNVAGSADPAQTVGGAWPGGYTHLITHALHHVTVGAGGSIAMTITVAGGGSFASLNGFQVVPEAGTVFGNCFPGTGGTLACPCGQPANPSGGCANFGTGATSGAVLSASGTPSLAADTVVLTTSNHRPASAITNVFFTGSGALSTGVPHGAGVRCVSTALKRLYTGQTSAGSLSRPGMGDPTISARCAALSVPISPGETRHYFNLYRDNQAAGPCGNTASTVNVTNGGSLTWTP
jgi:hypothetical protein